MGLAELGHDVVFVDVDEDRLNVLRGQGLSALHVDETSFDAFDAIFVAVPTPSRHNGIDLSYLDSACKTLGGALQGSDGKPLVVFRSTMPPGTTRNHLIPRLEQLSGKTAGKDFFVCYNPEYLRAESAVDDFQNFKFVTIGTASPGDQASELMMRIFAGFDATVREFSIEQAEFQKYVHNLFNAAKISFFNEMRLAAGQLGIADVDEIFRLVAMTAEGLWNAEYGTKDFGPYGGACLPKDVAAWLHYGRNRSLITYVIEATASINELLLTERAA
jgi:nucleotide sugar dehydrogenase